MQNKHIARLRNVAIGLFGAGGEISLSRSDAAFLGFEADSESIAVPVPDFIERVNGLESEKPVMKAKKSDSKAKKTESKPKQPDPDNEEEGDTSEGDAGKPSEGKSPDDETPEKGTAPKRSTAKKTDAK